MTDHHRPNHSRFRNRRSSSPCLFSLSLSLPLECNSCYIHAHTSNLVQLWDNQCSAYRQVAWTPWKMCPPCGIRTYCWLTKLDGVEKSFDTEMLTIHDLLWLTHSLNLSFVAIKTYVDELLYSRAFRPSMFVGRTTSKKKFGIDMTNQTYGTSLDIALWRRIHQTAHWKGQWKPILPRRMTIQMCTLLKSPWFSEAHWWKSRGKSRSVGTAGLDHSVTLVSGVDGSPFPTSYDRYQQKHILRKLWTSESHSWKCWFQQMLAWCEQERPTTSTGKYRYSTAATFACAKHYMVVCFFGRCSNGKQKKQCFRLCITFSTTFCSSRLILSFFIHLRLFHNFLDSILTFAQPHL